MLLVLDGMRRDYFDRYAASMPTLTALRQQSAWFTQARVNVLPSNTAVGTRRSRRAPILACTESPACCMIALTDGATTCSLEECRTI